MKNVRMLFLACIALGCSSEGDPNILERFGVAGKVTSITETPLGAVTSTFTVKHIPTLSILSLPTTMERFLSRFPWEITSWKYIVMAILHLLT